MDMTVHKGSEPLCPEMNPRNTTNTSKIIGSVHDKTPRDSWHLASFFPLQFLFATTFGKTGSRWWTWPMSSIHSLWWDPASSLSFHSSSNEVVSYSPRFGSLFFANTDAQQQVEIRAISYLCSKCCVSRLCLSILFRIDTKKDAFLKLVALLWVVGIDERQYVSPLFLDPGDWLCTCPLQMSFHCSTEWGLRMVISAARYTLRYQGSEPIILIEAKITLDLLKILFVSSDSRLHQDVCFWIMEFNWIEALFQLHVLWVLP